MNRRGFLKLLGVGVVTVLAFPGKLFAEKPMSITDVRTGLIAIGGTAGSLKSGWMMYQAMLFASQGKRVLYFDFDSSFSMDYAKKIQEANNINVPEGKLVILNTKDINWDILPKFDVVCFDSISTLCAPITEMPHGLSKVVMQLAKIAKKHNQLYIFAHQVYRDSLNDTGVTVEKFAPHPMVMSSAVFMAKPDRTLSTIKSRTGNFFQYKMEKSFSVRRTDA